ncbi:hypothetical protein ANANG_G00189620 [Anguilla anguilla]|uniref:Uncharacterized protein n=1 Tax=Anguilla anguilla TaxID=7936 RepID=A0A9D3M0U5_ANGAN|nr:hypothetical protein ANANG_G00189620 [Anguilla anguilla]
MPPFGLKEISSAHSALALSGLSEEERENRSRGRVGGDGGVGLRSARSDSTPGVEGKEEEKWFVAGESEGMKAGAMGIQGMELFAIGVVIILFVAVLKQFGILEPMSFDGKGRGGGGPA